MLHFPTKYIGLSRGYTATHKGADLGWNRDHGGQNVPSDAPLKGLVVSLIDGKDNTAPNSSYGNYIIIYHGIVNGQHTWTLQAHLLKGSFVVKVGDTVEQGQQLALMNNSGNSYGSHNHFEVRIGANQQANRVDPLLHVYATSSNVIGASTERDYTILREKWIGTPVARNESVNQVKPRDNANMHSRPEYNDATILGKATIGYYNALETRDMTHEASNGKYWYRVSDGQWMYDCDFYAVTADKDSIVKELEAKISKLNELIEISDHTNDNLTAALVSVRDTADNAIK